MLPTSDPINSSLIRLGDKRRASTVVVRGAAATTTFPTQGFLLLPFNTGANEPAPSRREDTDPSGASSVLAKRHIPVKILHLLHDADKSKGTGVNTANSPSKHTLEASSPRAVNYSLLCTPSLAHLKDKEEGEKTPIKTPSSLLFNPKFRKGEKKKHLCSEHGWIYKQHKHPELWVM